MKQLILIINIFFTLILQTSCNNPKNQYMEKNNVILYNSEEFKLFESKAEVKLKEAWDIQKKYAQNKNDNPKNWLFFVINGNYVFTSIFHPKIPEASIGGFWVNSETGEVREVKSDEIIRYENAYNGDGKEFFF